MVNSIALMASEASPRPGAVRNFAPIMLAVQFTPTTPTPLFPTAPIVPETWVPWPLSSRGSHKLVMALNPWLPAGQTMGSPPMFTMKVLGADQTFAAKSGCV